MSGTVYSTLAQYLARCDAVHAESQAAMARYQQAIEVFKAQVEAYQAQIALRYQPGLNPFVSARKSEPPLQTAQPDPSQPDTLGWRTWTWAAEHGRLVSPHHHTVWDGSELRVADWDESQVLRGVNGIHARRMPANWRSAGWPNYGYQEGPAVLDETTVTGVVERFGRYVLGALGWRAEWVVIKELQAPNAHIMLKLMEAYPEVKVHLRSEVENGHR